MLLQATLTNALSCDAHYLSNNLLASDTPGKTCCLKVWARGSATTHCHPVVHPISMLFLFEAELTPSLARDLGSVAKIHGLKSSWVIPLISSRCFARILSPRETCRVLV